MPLYFELMRPLSNAFVNNSTQLSEWFINWSCITV